VVIDRPAFGGESSSLARSLEMNASTLSLTFAGLSVGIAAIFHIVGLFNAEKARRLALETRQAEFLNDIYDKVIAPQPFAQFHEVVYEWKWDDYDDFIAKYGPTANPDAWQRFWLLCARWEHLGLLVREGIIDPELVWHWVGAFPLTLWNKVEPVILEFRARVEAEPKGMVFEWYEDLVVTLRQERARDRASFPERRRLRELQKKESEARAS
jgi:hypothetical protein